VIGQFPGATPFSVVFLSGSGTDPGSVVFDLQEPQLTVGGQGEKVDSLKTVAAKAMVGHRIVVFPDDPVVGKIK
jgi:hypothetical protein